MAPSYKDRSAGLLPSPPNSLPWTFQGMCTWIATNQSWAVERYKARKQFIQRTYSSGSKFSIDKYDISRLVSITANNENKVVAFASARFIELLNDKVLAHQAMTNVADEIRSIENEHKKWASDPGFISTIPETGWRSRIAGTKLATLVAAHTIFTNVLVGISYGTWGVQYAYSLCIIMVFTSMVLICASFLVAKIAVPCLLKVILVSQIMLGWILSFGQSLLVFFWGALRYPVQGFIGPFWSWMNIAIGWSKRIYFVAPPTSIAKHTQPFDKFVHRTSNSTMQIANTSLNMLPLTLFLKTSSESINHALLALIDWNNPRNIELHHSLVSVKLSTQNLAYTLGGVEIDIPYLFQSYHDRFDHIVLDVEELIEGTQDVPSTIASQVTFASYTIWAASFPFVRSYPLPIWSGAYYFNQLLNHFVWTVFSDQLACLGSDGLFSPSYFQPSGTEPLYSPRLGCAPIQTIAAGMGYITPEDYYHHVRRAKQKIDRKIVLMTELLSTSFGNAIDDVVKALNEVKKTEADCDAAITIWSEATGGLKAHIEDAIRALSNSTGQFYRIGWFRGMVTDKKERSLRELNRWKADKDELDKIKIWVDKAGEGLRDILVMLEDTKADLTELYQARMAFDPFTPLSDTQRNGEDESRRYSKQWKRLAAETYGELSRMKRMLKNVKANQGQVHRAHDEYLRGRKEVLEKQEQLKIDCGLGHFKETNIEYVGCLMDGLGIGRNPEETATTPESQETEVAESTKTYEDYVI